MTVQPTCITGKEHTEKLTAPIRALVDFYRAFNTGDMDEMSLNWAHAEYVSMDNPVGGITREWPEIKKVYDSIFNGPADVYVEFYDYKLYVGNDIFYVVGRERGRFTLGSKVIDLAIRTSRVYQLMNGRWQQVHHHGSIDDPELLGTYQAAVRGE